MALRRSRALRPVVQGGDPLMVTAHDSGVSRRPRDGWPLPGRARGPADPSAAPRCSHPDRGAAWRCSGPRRAGLPPDVTSPVLRSGALWALLTPGGSGGTQPRPWPAEVVHKPVHGLDVRGVEPVALQFPPRIRLVMGPPRGREKSRRGRRAGGVAGRAWSSQGTAGGRAGRQPRWNGRGGRRRSPTPRQSGLRLG